MYTTPLIMFESLVLFRSVNKVSIPICVFSAETQEWSDFEHVLLNHKRINNVNIISTEY